MTHRTMSERSYHGATSRSHCYNDNCCYGDSLMLEELDCSNPAQNYSSYSNSLMAEELAKNKTVATVTL